MLPGVSCSRKEQQRSPEQEAHKLNSSILEAGEEKPKGEKSPKADILYVHRSNQVTSISKPFLRRHWENSFLREMAGSFSRWPLVMWAEEFEVWVSKRGAFQSSVTPIIPAILNIDQRIAN